jgi:hypothetical protein
MLAPMTVFQGFVHEGEVLQHFVANRARAGPGVPDPPAGTNGALNGRGATLNRLKSGTTQVGSHFCGAQGQANLS